MSAAWLKKIVPHLIAVLIFLVVSVLYCKPALEGKVVSQHDVLQWKGMAQQSFEYKEKHGHFPLWTESMFGGMPAYTIAMDSPPGFSIGYVGNLLALFLPKPINFFFLACICFYFLALVFRIDPWVGVLSALGFAYCSYDPIIISVGHETKMLAMAYAPGVLAGLLLLYQRRYLWGSAVLLVFFSLQIGTQHLQIVYYTLIGMGLLTLCLGIDYWRTRRAELRYLGLGMLLAAVCGVVGYGTLANNLLPVQEYVKETMRGGRTELDHAEGAVTGKGPAKKGLDREYAFRWSYGIAETLTLLVPDVVGSGSDCNDIGAQSAFAAKFAEAGLPEESGVQLANRFAYWGGQELGTSGPVYLGAIVCFLCIAGAFFVKGWPKWWLVSFSVLGILLAWGKHFTVFNYFLFDYLPFYNKFRAPTIALFMPQLAFPLLGALGLKEMMGAGAAAGADWDRYKKVVYCVAGVVALLVCFYFIADYRGLNDSGIRQRCTDMLLGTRGQDAGPAQQQQAVSFSSTLMKALEQDRQSIYGADLVRSIVLIAAAVLLLGLFLKGKVNRVLLLGGLLVLSAYDLLSVGRRYLNEDNFLEPAEFEASYTPTAADTQIKQDPEKNFRVFDADAGSGWFQDARASYFFNSVGGYSPAKLGLYDDLIEHQLRKGNKRVFDMLNTRYIIQRDPANGQSVARLNPDAYGPCWLVAGIKYVPDGAAEMQALDSTDTRDTVVIRQQYAGLVREAPVGDTAASIRLLENLNDKLDYHFSARSPQFAVFSEIYYSAGWNAFIDGKKTDYLRVDYLLRGLAVPAGEHTIEFRFEPASYKLGNTIAMVSSMIAYVLLIAAIVVGPRRRII